MFASVHALRIEERDLLGCAAAALPRARALARPRRTADVRRRGDGRDRRSPPSCCCVPYGTFVNAAALPDSFTLGATLGLLAAHPGLDPTLLIGLPAALLAVLVALLPRRGLPALAAVPARRLRGRVGRVQRADPRRVAVGAGEARRRQPSLDRRRRRRRRRLRLRRRGVLERGLGERVLEHERRPRLRPAALPRRRRPAADAVPARRRRRPPRIGRASRSPSACSSPRPTSASPARSSPESRSRASTRSASRSGGSRGRRACSTSSRGCSRTATSTPAASYAATAARPARSS